MKKLEEKMIFGFNGIHLEPIKRISPSRYYNFTICSFREVLISNRVEESLPPHPNLFFGTAAHQIQKLVYKGIISSVEQLEHEWEYLIKSIETDLVGNNVTKHLVPVSKSIKMFEVRRLLLFKKLTPLLSSYRSIRASSSVISEQWYQTNDGKIGGNVDLLISDEENNYNIIEYKTGNVFIEDSKQLKPEYRYQLLLYAAILHENQGKWAKKLLIRDIHGKEYEISYDPLEIHYLVSEAKSILDKINYLINTESNMEILFYKLASPEPVFCRNCNFRPSCVIYWGKRRVCPDKNWPYDLQGELIDFTFLNNSTYLLRIMADGIVHSVRGLMPDRLTDKLQKNKTIGLFNLQPEKEVNCYYFGTFSTVIIND